MIWTGFVSKFVIKSSSKKSSATHVSNMYHACISHTGIHGYTCDTHRYKYDTQCDTHHFFMVQFLPNFQFKPPQNFTKSSQNWDSSSLSYFQSILITLTQNKAKIWFFLLQIATWLIWLILVIFYQLANFCNEQHINGHSW